VKSKSRGPCLNIRKCTIERQYISAHIHRKPPRCRWNGYSILGSDIRSAFTWHEK